MQGSEVQPFALQLASLFHPNYPLLGSAPDGHLRADERLFECVLEKNWMHMPIAVRVTSR
jgi:hypothetical protein